MTRGHGSSRHPTLPLGVKQGLLPRPGPGGNNTPGFASVVTPLVRGRQPDHHHHHAQTKRDLSPANRVPWLARQIPNHRMAKARILLAATTNPWPGVAADGWVSPKGQETREIQLGVVRFGEWRRNSTGWGQGSQIFSTSDFPCYYSLSLLLSYGSKLNVRNK